ncbi:MAG: hypothetical protein U1E47_01515 [Rivihabitans pingtungensis]
MKYNTAMGKRAALENYAVQRTGPDWMNKAMPPWRARNGWRPG